MKRWIWYLAALLAVAALGWMPFHGTDVAELQPVELLRIRMQSGAVLVETDTGDFGFGDTPGAAFADLKKSTAGDIFLETADHLILSPEAVTLLPELMKYLRPACNLCVEQGTADLEKATAFLNAHQPGVTLQDHRAGEDQLPVLVTREGRMHLVQE